MMLLWLVCFTTCVSVGPEKPLVEGTEHSIESVNKRISALEQKGVNTHDQMINFCTSAIGAAVGVCVVMYIVYRVFLLRMAQIASVSFERFVITMFFKGLLS